MQTRIIKETLLTVEFRQLGNVFRVVGPKLGQLLVNGDCLYGEAVLGVLVAYFLEIIGSVVVLAEPGVEVANSVQDRQVLGVFPDNFFILGDSIRELPCWTNFSAEAMIFALLKPNPSAIVNR